MDMVKSKGMMSVGLVALSTAFALSAPAFAQDDDNDVITVTGSQIQRAGNLVETSPVTSIGGEQFDVRGTLRVEDLINTLPQAFGAQGSSLANGATGTSSVNLRGLGSSRTLVLLNGRRMPYGSINIYAPDVNFIPAALVEQVDILTGGASAVYGADAVAGVVNFKLTDDFQGFRIDGNWSAFQHNNDGELQPLLEEFAALNPSQFRVPSGSTWDGHSVDVTAMWGGDFGDGRGRFVGYAGFQNTDEVLQGDRDYSQCALGTRAGGEEFTCSGSSTNQFANLLELAPGYAFPNGSVWSRVDAGTGTVISRSFTDDNFNFNPFNHFQRPNERYNFGFFTNYELADNAELYAEMMFMDNQTNSQIAPSGVFGLGVQGDSGGINCNNVFFSQQQFDFLCGSNGLTVDDVAPILILRRNVEGGERNQDISHTTYRGVVGVTGAIGNTALTYDVSAMYANVHRSDVYNNDLSIAKISRALNAVDDGSGNAVCAVNVDADPTNNDPACVPYDIWSTNGPSDASVAYLSNPLNRDGRVEQTVVSGKVSGGLGDYGFKAPWADDAAAFAAGIEYRRDSLVSKPDANFVSGDGAGQGGPTLPIEGSVDAFDVFVEFNMPLIQGREGIEQFGFDVAYRRSNYESDSASGAGGSFSADSYKFGLDYAPVADLRFRGSYQRAVRAPNIFELFSDQSIGLFDLTSGSNGLFDPCAGDFDAASSDPEPRGTAAQCANTGVTAAQYGFIADNPAGQFNGLFGGNPDLEPEVSDTYTLGAVFTPSYVDGLTVSLDYFDIVVEEYINNVPPDLSLESCLTSGDPFFCSLINRGTGGTLWANNTGFITATNINTGAISTKGYDLLATYNVGLGNKGDLTLDFVGTYLDSLEVKPLPSSTGTDIFDCAGSYGGRCQTNFGSGANPELRTRFAATWDYENLSLTGTWRHFDEVTQDGNAAGTGINGTLDSQDYFDLSARYQLRENISLRGGVNNIADQDPPLSSTVGTAPGNGNTYPQVYDALGRYVFLGATIEF